MKSISVEDLRIRTHQETLDFLRDNDIVSRDQLLKNAKSFFGSIKTDRKNTLFEKINDFSFKHKFMKQKIKQRIMKDRGGIGIGTKNSVPPETFQPNDLTFF